MDFLEKCGRQPVEGKPHIWADHGSWFCSSDCGDGVGDSLTDVWQDFLADRSYCLAQRTSSWAMLMALRPRPSWWARQWGLVTRVLQFAWLASTIAPAGRTAP